MVISKKMNKSLNDQITHELDASHRYLAMAYCFDAMGLKIFGKHFAKQSAEERTHALKIAKYVQDVGGDVELGRIDNPKSDYKNAKEIVKAALSGEETVTKQIHELMALAEDEKDYTARNFLEWFVNEQVEEEVSMRDLLQLVTIAGDANIIQVEQRLAEGLNEDADEEE